MKRRYALMCASLIAFSAVLPNFASADEWIIPGEEKIKISAGAILPSFDSSLRVNTTLSVGTDVDLERDLNLSDDEISFFGDITWRFARKHRLTLHYYNFDRDETSGISRELTIGDETYPIGASVSADFEIQIVPLYYSYSFVNNEHYEFGFSLGLHWHSADFKVSGSASLNDRDANFSASADGDAGLPLVGLFFDYRFSDKWTVNLHGHYLYLDLDDWEGSAVSLGIGTEYWIFNNLGLGAAVNWFNLDVDYDDEDWRGNLEYQYWGPLLYASLRF